ncbi:hypothetical protein QO002_001096 [Pararhizobium capsulatum DSM 1112]|uniref:CVNH domain-containing protein n=1 Tax=Pararhizobium capsulatum DSM 1112 TaxID=1121113 RepID=A0ABU0BL34_9HYPH|nr:hypothetical protein [Pararhizobium capsulatum]MDQ0318958.1 hypothetical protein [Pararhizobium capsulatum DSM 1112]
MGVTAKVALNAWRGREKRIGMKRLGTMTAAILLTIPAIAMAENGMFVIEGRCQKLQIGEHDFSNICSSKAVSTSYDDGRVGFHFVTNGGVALTFSGLDLPNISEDEDETGIDSIILNVGGGTKSSKISAVGRCRYGNPFKGKMTIDCKAKTGGMAYHARFKTNGKPPK